MTTYHTMSNAQITEIADRCRRIVQGSSGKPWDQDVRDAVIQALTETRGTPTNDAKTIDERLTRLERIVVATKHVERADDGEDS